MPVLDSGARGSTTTFAQRGIGDVLLSWENEAFLMLEEFGKDKFEIVVPVGQHPGRAAGDRGRQNASKQGTPKVAEAYLKFLYSDEGQEIIAKNYYRPRNAAVAKKYASQLPQDQAVHHRRGLRRLAKGPEDALRGQRRLRPDHPGRK